LKKFVLMAFIVGLFLCGIASAEIDLSTGKEVQIIDAGHSTPMALNGVVAATTTPTDGCDVLWDTTHGIICNARVLELCNT
jgi:hypothetical protein